MISGEKDTTAGIAAVAIPPRNTVVGSTIGQKVFLALPWQKHTNPITAFSIANLLDRRRMQACLNFGDAFVSHSRETCADLFLKSDCEWMLMIDDDMVLPGHAKWFNAFTGMDLPDKFANLNVVDRLLSHGKTLVGGLYFGKHKHGKPMYCEGCFNPAEEQYARQAPFDVIKPTKWVATGCLLIHRKVFLDIEARYPRLARNKEGFRGHFFTSSEDAALDVIDDCMTLIENSLTRDPTIVGEIDRRLRAAKIESQRHTALGIGEDVSFCRRAIKAGHQSFVDMGLVLGHIGTQIYGPRNTFPRI